MKVGWWEVYLEKLVSWKPFMIESSPYLSPRTPILRTNAFLRENVDCKFLEERIYLIYFRLFKCINPNFLLICFSSYFAQKVIIKWCLLVKYTWQTVQQLIIMYYIKTASLLWSVYQYNEKISSADLSYSQSGSYRSSDFNRQANKQTLCSCNQRNALV